jgi:hypothetical protein
MEDSSSANLCMAIQWPEFSSQPYHPAVAEGELITDLVLSRLARNYHNATYAALGTQSPTDIPFPEGFLVQAASLTRFHPSACSLFPVWPACYC